MLKWEVTEHGRVGPLHGNNITKTHNMSERVGFGIPALFLPLSPACFIIGGV